MSLREQTVETLREGASAAKASVVDAAKKYGFSAVGGLLNFLLIMAFVAAILAGWNLGQNLESGRGRLWGELLFFGLVIWLALVVLSALAALLFRLLPSWFPDKLRLRAIGHLEALGWTSVLLVAVPLAIRNRPESVVVFVAFTLGAIVLVFLGSQYAGLPTVPLWGSVVIGAVAVVLAFARAGAAEVTMASATPLVPGADDLARRFRPRLFLDSSETLEPVDIEKAEVHGCSYGVGARECDNPVEPTGPLDDFDYVKLTSGELREGEEPGGSDSAYYHHVVKKGEQVYIDYWWYFAHNPAPVRRNLLCGQALRWISEACAEHPGDWEGITLVLAACPPQRRQPACVESEAGSFRVEAARYAQHRKVVAYPWAMLQKRWQAKGFRDWVRGAGNRPLVFVALSSHASYAAPCGHCDQIADPRWKERRNGRKHWTNNDADSCAECLKPLPTTADGSPTAWNAFTGPWGAQHCILFGSYCDFEAAPTAPSLQRRYQRLDCVPGNCIWSMRL